MNPIKTITTDILGSIYLRADATIVFVCGKNIDDICSKRRIFVEYATRHMKGYHFLLAEKFFNFMQEKNQDLLTVENEIAVYSDCILILLESESAYTELGAFAVSDDLCKIIIPVNDKRYVDSESFINVGPLKKISNMHDALGPTINYCDTTFVDCFIDIEERLKKVKRKRRVRLAFNDVDTFLVQSKERLLFLYEIVRLFAPIKSKEIIEFLLGIFAGARLDKIYNDITLLLALNFIRRTGEFYIPVNCDMSFVVFFDHKYFLTTRAKVILFYQKNMKERLALLARG